MPELVLDWLETVKGTVRVNSYRNYDETAKIHVNPYFEALGLSVQEIKPVHIQKYYNLKHAEGLSASTIEKHRSNIHHNYKGGSGRYNFKRWNISIRNNYNSDSYAE